MGVLRVEVIGAKGLMAADRSGKSDVGHLWMMHHTILLISAALHQFHSQRR